MRIAIRIVAATLVLSASVQASNQLQAAEKDQRITRVAERLAEAAAEGASGILRISHRGDVIFEAGFGSASCDVDETITPAHIFMIGSITKELTRVLGFVLEEKGVISFDDKLIDHLPNFEGRIGKVTLRQLLDHTGGLPDLIDDHGRQTSYSVEYDYVAVTRDELIARAALAELIFEPGESEEYSNLGFQLLAAVYEVATSESYPDLLHRYIYGPAGMASTDFWFADKAERTFADGCRTTDIHWGNPIDDAMWDSSGPSWNLIGAGGLLSTAESLGRFFDGVGAGVYFDSPRQSEKYKAHRMVYSETRRQRVMGPAGSNGIFNAVAFWTDSDRFNLVLMTNRADHPAEGGLFRDIISLFPANYFLKSD